MCGSRRRGSCFCRVRGVFKTAKPVRCRDTRFRYPRAEGAEDAQRTGNEIPSTLSVDPLYLFLGRPLPLSGVRSNRRRSASVVARSYRKLEKFRRVTSLTSRLAGFFSGNTSQSPVGMVVDRLKVAGCRSALWSSRMRALAVVMYASSHIYRI